MSFNSYLKEIEVTTDAARRIPVTNLEVRAEPWSGSGSVTSELFDGRNIKTIVGWRLVAEMDMNVAQVDQATVLTFLNSLETGGIFTIAFDPDSLTSRKVGTFVLRDAAAAMRAVFSGRVRNRPVRLSFIGRTVLSVAPSWIVRPSGIISAIPGAVLAFSMQKVSEDYAGACVRVRRSSDDTEMDIGFDADGNLDTEELLTFVDSGDGFVTTWYDQSGHARNALQPTASIQPQIASAGAMIMEGSRPAISFTGFNGFLSLTGLTYNETNVYTLSVINPTYTGNPISWLSHMSIGNGAFLHRIKDGKYSVIISGEGPNFIAADSSQTVSGNAQIAEIDFDLSAIRAWENNSKLTMVPVLPDNIVYTNGIDQYQGTVQEILVYDRNMNGDRKALYADRSSYYGI